MRWRPFGSTGLTVSDIGFGCARIGGVFGSGSGTSSDTIALLRRAQDAGINLFDTADMYSQSESEALVGRAFSGMRSQVVIATKGGYCLPAQKRLVSRIKPLLRPIVRALGIKRENLPASVTGSLSQDFSPDHLVAAVEASLKRLGTDHIDLYQLHSPPQSVIESGDWREPLERMKAAGKVRFYGIACDTVQDAGACLKIGGLSSIQLPFGLLDLEASAGVLAEAERLGVAVIARGCFGGSLLKPSLTEVELKEKTEKWATVMALRETAKRNRRDLLEMALQFSLASPGVSVTLLGMRTEDHLRQNLEFLAGSPLTEAQLADLREAR